MQQSASGTSQIPKPVLIVDTNAFIRCLDIHKFAEKYDIYTSNNVLNEIRDKTAREKFLAQSFDIRTYSADDKSFDFVELFSKKTGDFSSLSFTDKELIAIGVHMVRLRGKGDMLRKGPPELTEWIPHERNGNIGSEEEEEQEGKNGEEQDNDGFMTVVKGKVFTKEDLEKDKKKKNGWNKENIPINETDDKKEQQDKYDNREEEPIDELSEKVNEMDLHEKEEVEDTNEEEVEMNEEDQRNLEGIVLERITGKEEEEPQERAKEKDDEGKKDQGNDDEDEEEDDGKGWINPDNISKKLYKGSKKEDQIQEIGVAIMTADYSMQNVIIQMGIPLLSTEGYIIRQTRRFVLECYCCEKICKNPTKQFCPSCGNPTLKKLSVHVNADGTMTYYRNLKKKISNRGKIYPIPKTEGGRKNDDLLLREDEFLMRGRLQQLERQDKEKDKKFKQRLKDYENGMTFDDITLKYKYNNNNLQIGYGRMNPNDRDQFKRKKR